MKFEAHVNKTMWNEQDYGLDFATLKDAIKREY